MSKAGHKAHLFSDSDSISTWEKLAIRKVKLDENGKMNDDCKLLQYFLRQNHKMVWVRRSLEDKVGEIITLSPYYSYNWGTG